MTMYVQSLLGTFALSCIYICLRQTHWVGTISVGAIRMRGAVHVREGNAYDVVLLKY